MQRAQVRTLGPDFTLKILKISLVHKIGPDFNLKISKNSPTIGPKLTMKIGDTSVNCLRFEDLKLLTV